MPFSIILTNILPLMAPAMLFLIVPFFIVKCGGGKKDSAPTPANQGNKSVQGAAPGNKDQKKIDDAIKNGELLPPDDNETVNDCESNWTKGAGKK